MNEILKKMHEVAASPRAQMDKYLAEGKKIVLCAPVYTPEEIIHSMGFVPMGAWGGDMELNRAKEYCPAFLCAIVQSLLELGITGAFEGASAIVIPSLCDTLKTVGENWKYAVPSIPFIPMTYPQNRKPAYGVAYTKAGYERVIRDLEKLGGTFSNEKLAASNAVYNRHNAAMRKIDALLAVHPEITAAQRSDIFKSAFFMTKEEHTELVEALIAKLEAQPAAAEKLPIVISGILTDAPALNAIIDEMGMHIVADDVAAQSRQYRTDVPAGDDALHADYALAIGESGTAGPTITINSCYEGLAGANLLVASGAITIYSEDDCLNAANSDLTGYDFTMDITGGTIWAYAASDDGLDSNGSLPSPAAR